MPAKRKQTVIHKKKAKISKPTPPTFYYTSSCDSSGQDFQITETNNLPDKGKKVITSFIVNNGCEKIFKLDKGLLAKEKLYLSGLLINERPKNVLEENNRIFFIGPIIRRWFTSKIFDTVDDKYESAIFIETEDYLYELVEPHAVYEKKFKFLVKKMIVTYSLISFLSKYKNKTVEENDFLSYVNKVLSSNNVNFKDSLLKKYSSYLKWAVSKFIDSDEILSFSQILPWIRELYREEDDEPACLNLELNDTSAFDFTETPKTLTYFSKTIATTTPIVENAFSQISSNFTEPKTPDEEESDTENIDVIRQSCKKNKIKWIGLSKREGSKVFYTTVKLDDIEINLGDFVVIKLERSKSRRILQVKLIWKEDDTDVGFFHGLKYMSSQDTILDKLGHSDELLMTKDCCCRCPLSAIYKKTTVTFIPNSRTWFMDGGKPRPHIECENYYCMKMYSESQGRFEDLPLEKTADGSKTGIPTECINCDKKFRGIFELIPRLEERSQLIDKTRLTYKWNKLLFDNYTYKVGAAVFLENDTFSFSNNTVRRSSENTVKIDAVMYPEYHRKRKGESEERAILPYCIGVIAEIYSKYTDRLLVEPHNIFLKVRKMYRPENIPTNERPHLEDLNLVYWSDEMQEVSVQKLVGPCSLDYQEKMPKELYDDHSRFYFNSTVENGVIRRTSIKDCLIATGKTGDEYSRCRPTLKMMELFAGCGGLSTGLVQSGIAESKWAVEINTNCCISFKTNHPDALVYNQDCNILLSDILNKRDNNGQPMPKPGEVDLICGGPPCQGFSNMNRFNQTADSFTKNSLVMNFLSYVDYYRPTYAIMENVKNFVNSHNGLMLASTMKAFVDIGYQCAVGILQAGNYGVPQSRKRIIFFASAPGNKLPEFPQLQNAFFKNASFTDFTVNRKTYVKGIRRTKSAPRRALTVKDAIYNMPVIGEETVTSLSESTHYQRSLQMENGRILQNHVCRKMSPLASKRISLVPQRPNSDWRNLPNARMLLSDGTYTKILKYDYYCKKTDRYGVCPCIAGGRCDPKCNQPDTLIPWCLAHTADKHCGWVGLYGRINMNSYFDTVVTNPDPIRKQGKTIHPFEDRVLSVREYARAQGFPDNFVFSGTIDDQYIQIGNAVPPPLARALGNEIKKAINCDIRLLSVQIF